MNYPAILQYLLSANILLLTLALFYRLFLARLPKFQWNRLFLVIGSTLALLLPLIRVDISSTQLQGLTAVSSLPEVIINGGPTTGSASLDWSEILGIIYLSMALLFALLLLLKVGRMFYFIATAERESKGDYTLIHHPKLKGPASFFRFLFWNQDLEDDREKAAFVMAHERCHIRQGHTLDRLWMEALAAACWFNPAAYLLKADLKRCHEYLADQAALQVGGEETFKQLVLASHFGGKPFPIANHFQSQIKARLTMMNLKSAPKSLLRYLLILPLGLFLFACSSIESDTPKDTPGETPRIEAEVTEAPATDPAPEADPATEVSEESDPDPNEFQLLDNEPRPLNMEEVSGKIGYPNELKENGVEGKVIVRVLVGKDGSVEQNTVLKQGHPDLEKAILAHINDLKFSPGVKDGKSVKAWVTIPFDFKLN